MWPVRTICRVLGLSASGYYAWVRRKPSARERRDGQLRERIRAIWGDHREVYGRPRIHAELRAQGEPGGAVDEAGRHRRGQAATLGQDHAA